MWNGTVLDWHSSMIDLSMRVKEFMSREVVTVDAAEHLDVAADLMRLGRLRHLPVMSGGRLVGIITQRDLFQASSSSVRNLRPDAARDWIASISVSEVMIGDVVTTEPEASMRSATEVMLVKKIGCLPVVDQGKLVGVVSETDCLRLLSALLARRDAAAASCREGNI
jgi:CBS domain-containing protein